MDFGSSACAFLLLLACTFIHILRTLHARSKTITKLPPGPSLLTMMGNLHELFKSPQQWLAKLAEIHGPIMRLQIGQGTATIVISSPEMAREILQTNDILFADRSVPDITTAHDHNQWSLAFLPASPLWQDLRKICHHNLFATKTLDASRDLRRQKLLELLSDMHRCSMEGEAVDIGRAAFKTCINFLSYTFVSQDFVRSLDDEYKDIVATLLKAAGTPNVVDFVPALKMFDPQGMRRHTANYLTKLFNILDRLIEERSKLRKEKYYVTNNDMLDTLLDIAHDGSQKMDNKKIRHLLLDLLVAGTDTTAYGLERAMTELLHNPSVMSKAKKELEEIIGKGNPVEESDIERLPYLQAVIKESLRVHPPAPLLLPRRAKKDVEISGYTIPKGAQVLINEWSIGRNTSVWDNANLFSPERFVGSELDVKGRHFQLTPFGSGRRICPGSPLAIRMLHLMLGSLINCFDWKLENDMQLKDMDLDKPLQAIPVMVKC